MIGIDKNTGKALSGLAHLKQSIEDILTTPKGTRIMRREYGSNLPRLVDNPLNRETILDMIAESADALNQWEPRMRVTEIKPTELSAGRIIFRVIGEYLPDGQTVTLDGIRIK